MKISLEKIIKIDNALIELDFSEVIEGLDTIYGDCEFTQPASFKGQLSNYDGVLSLRGRLKAEYKANCSRCLKEINNFINTTVDEKLVSEKSDHDIEVYTYEGNVVDISKILKDNIILALPVRQLCSEDCKGICPTCGVDLNFQDCNCNRKDVDLRLEVLKNFFNKN